MKLLKREPIRKSGYQQIIKALIITVLLFILYAIYSGLFLIIPSPFIVILLMLAGFLKLAHTFGVALMYPGAFKYFKGSVQLSYSADLLKGTDSCIVALLEGITAYLHTGMRPDIRSAQAGFEHYVAQFVGIYSKFQHTGTLSPKKHRLLALFRAVLDEYDRVLEGHMTINNFLVGYSSTSEIQLPSSAQLSHFAHLLTELEDVLLSFVPPQGLWEGFKFQTWGEKLYELSFGYYAYDTLYHYNLHTVLTSDGEKLELITIQGLKRRQELQTKRTIMICNPNGAFMQLFALETKYIPFYIENGYKVAIWNYRGYGNSTGTPTLSNCESDSLSIYGYLSENGYEIEVVHGYSIGGPAAVFAASAAQIPKLVVDRTFYALDTMAQDYGKFLTFLMKLLFYKDRRNYAELYLTLHSQKFIICDPYDEVIKNVCSLKSGVSSSIISLGSPPTELREVSVAVIDESAQLYQKSSAPLIKKQNKSDSQRLDVNPSNRILTADFCESFAVNIMNFARTAKKNEHNYHMSRQKIQVSLTESALAESIQYLTSKYLELNKGKEIWRTIILDRSSMYAPFRQEFHEIMDRLDAAGLLNVAGNYSFLSHARSDERVLEEITTYLQDLLVFGSYRPYEQEYFDAARARQHTIVKPSQDLLFAYLQHEQIKIYEAVRELESLAEVCKSRSENDMAACLKLIAQQIGKIGLLIHETMHLEPYRRTGVLLPVRSGHNGELKPHEMNQLRRFVLSEKEPPKTTIESNRGLMSEREDPEVGKEGSLLKCQEAEFSINAGDLQPEVTTMDAETMNHPHVYDMNL